MSTTTWRRLCYILSICIAIMLLNYHFHNGYPQGWEKVQLGMTPAEVETFCGVPSYQSGMKPDIWERSFLWGKWVLQVDCGDYSEGGPDVVYRISLVYDHDIAGLKMRIRSEQPSIKDYAAFIRAFGFEPNPNIKYRVVEDR